VIEITDLFVYPVKSLGGIALDDAEVSIRGFKFDREWMITDSDYSFVTQRQIEIMATIKVCFEGSFMVLRSSTGSQVKVPLDGPQNHIVKAKVWDDVCYANDEGSDVAEWLTKLLGKYNNKSLRLVRFAYNEKRMVPEKHLKGSKAQSAFSDQFPFLITSWESLKLLNKTLKEKGQEQVEMSRFRPNIVINGLTKIEEKQTHNLHSTNQKYFFGLRKPCKRCKITTINQDSGEITNIKEPLSTLTSLEFNKNKVGAFFGQNAICSIQKDISVRIGDTFNLRIDDSFLV
jgi:hypothetical protein